MNRVYAGTVRVITKTSKLKYSIALLACSVPLHIQSSLDEMCARRPHLPGTISHGKYPVMAWDQKGHIYGQCEELKTNILGSLCTHFWKPRYMSREVKCIFIACSFLYEESGVCDVYFKLSESVFSSRLL